MAPTGAVRSLTTATGYGAPLDPHTEVELLAGVGIVGDRHAGNRRQVTIVCTGELAEAARRLGVAHIDGASTRRNIVVDTATLPRAHGTPFRIGAVEFEVWRDCAPCELMDEIFGSGAKDALRDRCGISATVINGGTIRLDDRLVLA